MALTGLPRALTWDDFSEVDETPDGGDELAYTEAKWSLSYGFPPGTGDYKLNNIVVSVRILSDKSWVVTEGKTDALLKHEQGHYDITALGARDLHRALPALRAKTEAALRAKVDDLDATTQAAVNAMNDKYDSAAGGTNHGLDAAAQVRWSGKIRGAIANPNATLSSVG